MTGLTPLKPASLAISQTPWWLLVAVMLVIGLPVVALSQFASALRVDVVDDQLFGYFGWRILHGATVYVDIWDNKPPGIYWINALGFAVSGDRYVGVLVLCALAVLTSGAAFFVIAASIYSRGAAALATILAVFYMNHGFYQGGANRTETFLIAFELCAAALYFRGFRHDRNWIWLTSGMLCGCAFLLKQVGLAGWGAMGLHLIVLALLRDLPVGVMLRRGLLMLTGTLIVVGAAIIALAWQGALEAAAHAIVTFNRAYFEHGASSFTNTFLNRYFLINHLDPLMRLPLLMALAALIHAFLWWLRPLLRPPEIAEPLRAFGPAMPRAPLLLTVWFGVAFYGAVLSPHYFEHYLLPTFAPLLLLAGYLLNVLRAEVSLMHRMQQRAWVCFAFVFIGYMALSAIDRHFEVLAKIWLQRFPGDTFVESEWEVVGDAVRRRSTAEQRVQCFGYLPGAYLQARRLSATRFATTEKLGQVRGTAEAQRMQDEMIAALSSNPPTLLVMSSNDHFEMHNPEQARDPVDDLGRFLPRLLAQHYVYLEDIQPYNYMLFKRRDQLLPHERPLPEVIYPAAASGS